MFKPHIMIGRAADGLRIFETTGFYLACYLRCDGFRLASIGRQGPRAVFQFEERTDRERTALAFFNNQSTVGPLTFSSAIKGLKALIHKV